MRPKFTTGMKEVLFAIAGEARRQWWWLVLALAFALMLWLAPKVEATPLEDFVSKHNLVYPKIALEQAKTQNLVAGAGIMNEKDQTFTVYFLTKPETFDIQEFDVWDAKMEVRFYLVKKRVIVEYVAERDCSHAGKCWPNNHTEKVFIFLDFWHL